MTIGKCYHSNGNEMTDDFKIDFLPELMELLSVKMNNKE